VMTNKPRIWMRHEVRPTERRAPIVPADTRLLVEAGIAITVEDSPQRLFPISDYAAVGCRIAEPGSWVGAPGDEYIIGLKELPDAPAALFHQHVFFGMRTRDKAAPGNYCTDSPRVAGPCSTWSTSRTSGDTVSWRSGTGPATPVPPRTLVIGAFGRGGRGARDALAVAGYHADRLGHQRHAPAGPGAPARARHSDQRGAYHRAGVADSAGS
jgi:saccharopine dehydrogenase (NAD+, L-lysine-forming)